MTATTENLPTRVLARRTQEGKWTVTHTSGEFEMEETDFLLHYEPTAMTGTYDAIQQPSEQFAA